MNRKDEMKRLRFEEFKTLQEIADIYNLSRERVRQIVGNTGSFVSDKRSREKTEFVMASKDMTHSQLIQALKNKFGTPKTNAIHLRGKFRHAVESNSWAWHGAKHEDLVSKKLNSLGIENKQMPHGHPFDILLANGKKIDVKASTTKRVTSPSQKHTMYSFSVRKNKKRDYCDFFICYIVPEKVFFVIPCEEVSATAGNLYITYPQPARSWAKWHEYEDRFDLLQ